MSKARSQHLSTSINLSVRAMIPVATALAPAKGQARSRRTSQHDRRDDFIDRDQNCQHANTSKTAQQALEPPERAEPPQQQLWAASPHGLELCEPRLSVS